MSSISNSRAAARANASRADLRRSPQNRLGFWGVFQPESAQGTSGLLAVIALGATLLLGSGFVVWQKAGWLLHFLRVAIKQ